MNSFRTKQQKLPPSFQILINLVRYLSLSKSHLILDGAYVFLIDDGNTTFTQEAFEVAEIMNEFSPRKALRSNIWFELDSSLFNDFTEDYLLNEDVQPFGVKDFIWKRLYKEDKEVCKKILRKLTVANEDQIKRHIMNVQGWVS